MSLIKIVDGQPVEYSIAQLLADNPLTQFPSDPKPELLALYGVYTYTVAPEPAYDPYTQRLQAGNVQAVGSDFVQPWTVVNLSTEEIAARTLTVREGMSVPRLAARLALIEEGLWDSIPALIDAIPDATQKAVTLAYFEDAVTWRRLDPTVAALAAGLGLSDAQLDALFTLAQSKV